MLGRDSEERRSIEQTLLEVRDSSFKEGVVLWVGSRPGDYKNIDFIYPDGTIGTRYGKDTINIARNYTLFSAEERTRTREDSGMEQLGPYLREFLGNYQGQEIHIIAYHSTPQLEELAREFPRLHLLNSPYELKEALDEKNYTRAELSKRGVKTVPSLDAVLEREGFDLAESEFGLPFFLQMNVAWSGFGSFMINGREDFDSVLEENGGKEVCYMPFIKGKSLNINAVRTANYNVFNGLSFQIIGEETCISKRFGYCGNDFNLEGKLSEGEREKVRVMLEQIGDWVGGLGYRGLYGVDLLSDGEEVYFTEINPRFQGSTSLFTDQQIENGIVPLTLFHLTAYLKGFSLEPENLERYNTLDTRVDASQILLHNLTGNDVHLVSSPEPGRYIFQDGELVHLGPANFLSERMSDDEFVLAGDVPLNGTRVLGKSDELCKIYFKGSVLGSDGRRLTNRSRQIAQEFYGRFVFE